MTYIVEPDVQASFDYLEKDAAEFTMCYTALKTIIDAAYHDNLVSYDVIPKQIKNISRSEDNAVDFSTMLTHFFSHHPATIIFMFGPKSQTALLQNDNRRHNFVTAHKLSQDNKDSIDNKTFEIDYFCEAMASFAEDKRDLETLVLLDKFKLQSKTVGCRAHELGNLVEQAEKNQSSTASLRSYSYVA